MKFKRVLATLMVAVGTLGLAGCGSQGQQIAQQQKQAHQDQTTQPQSNNNRQQGGLFRSKPQQPVVHKIPGSVLAESVLTPSVQKQLGGHATYNGTGSFNIANGPKLNVKVASAPYVMLPKRNPAHGNRLEGTARAWLNHSSRQYQNRNQTGNGRGNFKPVGFVQRMGLNAQTTGYNHLYDRGHLIAYAIAGNVRHFNASESNPQNIVTQTAWSNEAGYDSEGRGQNYYEGIVRKALDQNQQVMYAVTPIYNTDHDLVPAGMHLQATLKNGRELFNVFVPNVQPGVKINYTTGQSTLADN